MRLNYFRTRSKIPDIDVNKYLEKIGVGKEPPSFPYLKKLHRNHLLNIPVENLDIHYGNKISLNIQELYHKLIEKNRGGLSFENNALFYALLSHLGFECAITSAQLKTKEGFDSEFSHMVVLVLLDNVWLSDVGLIHGFFEPKNIHFRQLQVDYTQYFQFEQDPDDHILLKKSSDASLFKTLYRFDFNEKELIQFLPIVKYHEESFDSYYKQNKIISKPSLDGYVTLTDRKLITFTNGELFEKAILNEDEFLSKLDQYFEIQSRDLLRQDIE